MDTEFCPNPYFPRGSVILFPNLFLCTDLGDLCVSAVSALLKALSLSKGSVPSVANSDSEFPP